MDHKSIFGSLYNFKFLIAYCNLIIIYHLKDLITFIFSVTILPYLSTKISQKTRICGGLSMLIILFIFLPLLTQLENKNMGYTISLILIPVIGAV